MNLLCRGKRLRDRDHRLEIWKFLSCNLIREEERNTLSWPRMGNTSSEVLFSPHLIIPHRILLGGISEHLIYPISVLWYLHKGIWRRGARHEITISPCLVWSSGPSHIIEECTFVGTPKGSSEWRSPFFHCFTTHRYISGTISEAAMGLFLQVNSVCGPKSILETTSAQCCRPANLALRVWKTLTSVTGPYASYIEVLPFPGA